MKISENKFYIQKINKEWNLERTIYLGLLIAKRNFQKTAKTKKGMHIKAAYVSID